MRAVSDIPGSGVLVPLVLVVLLTLTANANSKEVMVTVEPCHKWFPLRQYPIDSNATLLYMQDCRLTELKVEYITGLPNITIIMLSDNHLEYIELAAFRTVPTLEALVLRSNKLRELPVFPTDSCTNLDILDLSHNQITSIHEARTFAACEKLRTFDLSFNQIAYIHPEAFRFLPDLNMLDLRHNKLTFIPSHMFAENKKRDTLNLYINYNRLNYLPENFASSLKQGGVGLTHLSFLANPWHCACLLELLADVKSSGVPEYDDLVEYHKQPLPCVFVGPYPCTRSRASGMLPPSPPPRSAS